MKDQENDETEDQSVEIPARTARKRHSERDGAEPGVVRIKLPAAVGVKAKETVAELRARGAQVTLDELLSEYIEVIPERYFEAQLQKRTPEPYYLEAAAKVPELREVLIRLAKKGLLRNAAPGSSEEGSLRRKRRADHADAGENQHAQQKTAEE